MEWLGEVGSEGPHLTKIEGLGDVGSLDLTSP